MEKDCLPEISDPAAQRLPIPAAPSTAYPRLVLGMLFVVLVLQSLIVPVILRMYDAQWPDALAIVAMGLAFGQVGLSALLLVLVAGSLVFRGLASLVLYGGGAFVAACSVGNMMAAWMGIMLLVLSIVTVPFLIARLAGVAILLDRADGVPRGSRQYTIWGLLVLTTLAAVLLGIGRQLDFPWSELGALALFSVTIAAVPCVIGPLAASRVPWPATLIACLTICPATGVMLAFTGFPPQHPVELASMCTVQGAVLVAACVVARMAGFRLVGPWER